MSDRRSGDLKRPVRGTPSGTELVGLGIAIAVTVIVPMLLGLGLDALLHTSPLLTSIGLVAGIVLAVLLVVSRFRQYLS